MYYSPVRHSSAPEGLLPFDLHVLGMPPAFNLSHDQTLKFNLTRHFWLTNQTPKDLINSTVTDKMNWYKSASEDTSLVPGITMVIVLTNANTHTNYMNLSIFKELTESRLGFSKDGQLYLLNSSCQHCLRFYFFLALLCVDKLNQVRAHYIHPPLWVNR